MKSVVAFVVLLIVTCANTHLIAQNNFYNQNEIQTIEVFFSQANWDYQLDTAKAGFGSYIVADSVRINGTNFINAGIKYKGNSSYNATNIKNPLHIELNHILEQNYDSYTDIKLSTGYGDPSSIREVLSYDILSNYMICPKANFVNVYINDTLIGLYTNVESINKSFYEKNFFSDNNTAFKCNPTVTPGPTTKSNLKFLSTDSLSYYNFYELQSNTGWSDLLKLNYSVTNNTSSLADSVTIDRVIWMLAFNNCLVNLDSYSGVFGQNYYLYKDNTGHFNPIIWDLNMSFGSFPYVGSGASSMGSLTIANMQQLPVSIHSTDVYWPLIKAIFANSTYKKMYYAHLKTIVSEIFETSEYLVKANELQTLITNAVISDTNDYFTDSEFTNALTTNYTFGSYSVPGIQNLMESRTTYLLNSSELSQSQPFISLVQTSSTNPSIGETVYFTTTISNSTSVFLGFRPTVYDHFERIQMFDDGLHGDGVSGDNTFGASLLMNSAQYQYYIFAENNSTSVFSPERAEFEFYTITSNLNTPDSNEIVINEIVSNNSNGSFNEYGNQSDWLEIYNNTSSTVDLFGLYLSDDIDNPTKFQLPQASTIAPFTHKAIWFDNDPTSSEFIHADFNLNNGGETIYLFNCLGNLIDSITYFSQFTDESFGRCPDGSSHWETLIAPTFEEENCIVTVSEIETSKFVIFPNPFIDVIKIQKTNNDQISTIKVIDMTGKNIYSSVNGQNEMNLAFLNRGIYHLIINDCIFKTIIKL